MCLSGGPDSEQPEETGSEEAHAAAHRGDASKEVSVEGAPHVCSPRWSCRTEFRVCVCVCVCVHCRQDLKDTFIDSGVMMAIKEWISPLPDKSLPALKIRGELLKILQEVSLALNTCIL